MPRLVKPDGEKIRRLCEGRVWGAPELAKASGLALLTASKIMSGKKCFRNSLRMVARVFDKPESALIELPDEEPEKEPEEKTINVHFHFPISVNRFDEGRIMQVIELLKQLINATGDIDVADLRAGSTILTLSMNEEDALRLMASLEARKTTVYSKLGTTSVEIDEQDKRDLMTDDPDLSERYQTYLTNQRAIAAKEQKDCMLYWFLLFLGLFINVAILIWLVFWVR